jgi:integrase
VLAVVRSQRDNGPMAAKLQTTNTPGIFRRHAKECARLGRCDCSYVTVWRHRGRQHTETFRTLAEAREAKGTRDAGDRRPSARIAFGDYFDGWIESYAGRTARGFSESTRCEYRRPIETWAVPRWESWRLTDIEPADVRALFGELRTRGTTPANIKKPRAALSALFATAVEDGHVRGNPVQGVRIPASPVAGQVKDSKPKALTRQELGMLLSAIPAEWRLFFELLAHTGLRISEAVGLTWEHVDLGDRPQVRVREQVYRGERKRLKSNHGRRDIPLSPGMVRRLIEHRRDTYRGDHTPVFASVRGAALHPSNVRSRVLLQASKPLGLEWVGFHTFRHTCASLLFEGGKNVKQVQEWLGHADPGFTLRTYVHLLDDGLGSADFFDEVLRRRPSIGPRLLR